MKSADIKLVERLGEKLKAERWLLATAESCTGGLAGALCTTVPGSSEWFQGGIISYSNEIKIALLGVPRRLVEAHGAVSVPVVEQMAIGALRACTASCSVAISGIAGPDGGTPEKPVGTVCIAVARPASVPVPKDKAKLFHTADTGVLLYSGVHHFEGDREAVRMQAAVHSLRILFESL